MLTVPPSNEVFIADSNGTIQDCGQGGGWGVLVESSTVDIAGNSCAPGAFPIKAYFNGQPNHFVKLGGPYCITGVQFDKLTLTGCTPGGAYRVWVTSSPAQKVAPAAMMHKTLELFDSGIVAGGAQILTPLLDVSNFRTLGVAVQNADVASRGLNFHAFRPDGTSEIIGGVNMFNFTTNAYGQVGFFGEGVATGGPGVYFAWAGPLPTKIKLELSAGGSSNGRMTVWGKAVW